MKRIRIIHRLRMALALLGFSALVGGAGLLWWANHTGLPDSWRGGIEEALAANGLHAELASLRYLPLRGIEAGEVVIYTDASRRRILGRLDHLLLDIDRTKLSRGDFKVQQLDLSGARVTLAVDPEDPASKVLEIADARGRIEFSGPRQMEISNASGTVGGLRLEGRALMNLYRQDSTGTLEDMERARAERRRILIGIIEALEHFDLEAAAPPTLRIDARGDLEEHGSLRADLTLRAANLTSRGIDIRRLDIDGELRGQTLVLNRIDLETPSGTAGGKLEYELDDFEGRFQVQSDTDLPALAAQLGLSDPESMPTFAAPPELNAHGSFHRDEDRWHFRVIGDVELSGPSFRHLSADRVATRFSWDGSRVLLEDLEVQDGIHRLDGRAFIEPERVRYEFTTDLPLAFWQNAVTIQPLSDILDDFSAGEEAATRVECRGMANLHDPLDWSFKGTAEAGGLSFRGVPTRHAAVTMDLGHRQLDFTSGEVDFDYSDYRLRKVHGGPSSGTVAVDRILYDNEKKTIEISKLRGTAWPAPIVRTFESKVADELENYRFHRPPTLAADGTIGIMSGLPRQDLKVRFSSPAAASYEFLDEDLDLSNPGGTVRVLADRVSVLGLEAGVLDGSIRTDFDIRLGESRQRFDGEIVWTGLSLPAIATTYGFDSTPKGSITGRMDFSLTGTDVSGLDGSGNVTLEDGELFEVPIFGPLSPLISAVLGRRKAGFQEANQAFCTFRVDDGVISTTDFFTSTPSIHFTGDGKADLPKDRLDMTIRMNARGLFGLITLPLRPIYEGLFQFRGSGPIDNPDWRTVSFTSPPEEQKSRLLDPPKARPVAEPPRARIVAPAER